MNYRFQKKLHSWQLVNEQGDIVYRIVKEIWQTGIDITDVHGDLIGQSRIVNDQEHRCYRYDEKTSKDMWMQSFVTSRMQNCITVVHLLK